MQYTLTCNGSVRHISGAYYLSISFRTDCGIQTALLPRSQKARPDAIITTLLDLGAILPDTAKDQRALVETALRAEVASGEFVTPNVGWHEDTFVLPDVTIGPKSGKLRYLFQEAWGGRYFNPQMIGDYTSGTLEAWREGLVEPCRFSSFLPAVMCTSFAAPLLEKVGASEGFLINLQGPSGAGKTTALLATQSVGGQAVRNKLVTFDFTKTGVQEHAAASNGQAIVIDELGRLEGTPKQREASINELSYMIGGGRGRKRSKAAVALGHRELSWTTAGVTSSETRLGSDRPAGAEVRMIDLAIPEGTETGIFDLVPEGASSAPLAAMVEDTIKSNYGHALRAYVGYLIETPAAYAEAKRIIDEFVAKVAGNGTLFEKRFAGKFGALLAGGVIAVRAGVAPWGEKQIRRAIGKAYRIARRDVATSEARVQAVLREVAKEAKSGRRFPLWKKGRTVPEDAWGVRRTVGGTRKIVLLPEAAARIASRQGVTRTELDAELVRLSLVERNPANGGVRSQIALRWRGRPWAYVLDATRLAETV